MATNIYDSNHMQTTTWTNGTGSDVTAGQIVVMGALEDATLAVALVDIADGDTGSVGYNCGVTAAKVSAAVYSKGESLVFDISANGGLGAFDDNQATPATGDVSGSCRADSDGANLETSGRVWLTGIPGTLTA